MLDLPLILGVFLLVVLIGAIRARRSRLTDRQKVYNGLDWDFTRLIDSIDVRIVNDFTRGLDEVEHMVPNLEGDEREHFERMNEIICRVYMILNRLRSKGVVGRSNLGSLEAVENAIASLRTPFTITFDDEDALLNCAFALKHEPIVVNPETVEQDLNTELDHAKILWDELMEATILQRKLAQDQFPHTEFEELERLCDLHNIPRRWLREHPLFNNDERFVQFYRELNELRVKRPFAFKKKLEELHALEAKIKRLVNELINIVNDLEICRILNFDSLPIVLDPEHNPTLTLTRAHQAENDLRALLETSDDLELIRDNVGKVIVWYNRALALQTGAELALGQIKGQLAMATDFVAKAEEIVHLAQTTASESERMHKNLNHRIFLSAATGEADLARNLLAQCNVFLGDHRIINAQRKIDDLVGACSRSLAFSEDVMAHCKFLDEQKERFLKELEEMPQMLADARAAMKRFDGDENLLTDVNEVSYNEPVNYSLLLIHLSEQRHAWDNIVSRAKTAWNAEQKRLALYQAYRDELTRASSRDFDRAVNVFARHKVPRTFTLNLPLVDENASSEQIEVARQTIFEHQAQWSEAVRQAKYARELELKRLDLVQKYQNRLNLNVNAISTARIELIRYGQAPYLRFDPPNIHHASTIPEIEAALQSLEIQMLAWDRAVESAKRVYEQEREFAANSPKAN